MPQAQQHQVQQSPVFLMMGKDDAFELTLIAMMQHFAVTLKNREWDRHGCNTRRYTWLQQVHDVMEKIEAGYTGCLPEEFTNKAGKFCDMINADLKCLMMTIKGK